MQIKTMRYLYTEVSGKNSKPRTLTIPNVGENMGIGTLIVMEMRIQIVIH